MRSLSVFDFRPSGSASDQRTLLRRAARALRHTATQLQTTGDESTGPPGSVLGLACGLARDVASLAEQTSQHPRDAPLNLAVFATRLAALSLRMAASHAQQAPALLRLTSQALRAGRDSLARPPTWIAQHRARLQLRDLNRQLSAVFRQTPVLHHTLVGAL